jgi:hypothetical protein
MSVVYCNLTILLSLLVFFFEKICTMSNETVDHIVFLLYLLIVEQAISQAVKIHCLAIFSELKLKNVFKTFSMVMVRCKFSTLHCGTFLPGLCRKQRGGKQSTGEVKSMRKKTIIVEVKKKNCQRGRRIAGTREGLQNNVTLRCQLFGVNGLLPSLNFFQECSSLSLHQVQVYVCVKMCV